MKRLTICVLFLFGLLLSCTGCLHEPIESSVHSPVTTPVTTAPSAIDTSNFTYYVNISNESVWDLCPFMDTELTYMLLSREPLPDNSQVMLMFTNRCGATYEKVQDGWMTEFPFWLYQTYRGVDWKVVASLADAARNGNTAAAQELEKYDTLYLEDYEKTFGMSNPPLYGYWITNNVTTNQNTASIVAQHNEIPFLLNNEESLVNVGQLKIYRKGWDQVFPAKYGDHLYKDRLPASCTTYWGDGTVRLAPIVLEAVAYPQTLAEVELYGIEGEIYDIQVSIEGNMQSWDGNTAFEIPAYSRVELIATLKTMANSVIGYCEDANILVRRDMNGSTQWLWYFTSISQSWNIYELYALVVDGLDIASYYEYKSHWEQPEPVQKTQSTDISFNDVVVADTSRCAVKVTHTSWDDYGYTVHFWAENRSDQMLTIAFDDTYINNWYTRFNCTIDLEPEKAGEYEWCIAWDAMEEIGIYTKLGTDIKSIEFLFTSLCNGEILDNGYENMQYICINPLGIITNIENAIQESPVLETDTLNLFSVRQGTQQNSCLTRLSAQPVYEFAYIIENLSESAMSYLIKDFCIDDTPVDGIDAATIRAGGRYFSVITNHLSREDLDRIRNAKTISFTVILNNTSTYTVTIDLTKEMEDKGK